MSWRRVCGQYQITQVQAFTIIRHARYVHRRKRKPVVVFRIIMTAALQQRGIRGTRDHLCTRVVRELRNATGMVGMRMRIENPSDVAQTDAETSDVRLDQRGIPRHAAVDQDVTRTRGDEEDAEAMGPDVPGIAIYAKRLLWGRP